MTDTTQVLHHIAELYAKNRKDQDFDSAVLEYEEKLNHRFDDYDKAFAGNLTDNIIKAVDDYWRYKSDKVRPTIAQIMAMANSDGDRVKENSESRANMRQRIEKCAAEIEDKFGVKARNRYIRGLIDAYGVELKPETEEKKKSEIPNPAVMFMQRDIALGKCRHLLPMYQRAVNYILTDLLSREVPTSVWQNMDFGARYSAAMKKGLFNKFDELLAQICKSLTGREYQFQSKNDITNVNFTPRNAVSQVAAHFRANDDDEELGKSIGF